MELSEWSPFPGEESNQNDYMGTRPLRDSGGSVVVTIPPDGLEMADMERGDDVVLSLTDDTIILTKMTEFP